MDAIHTAVQPARSGALGNLDRVLLVGLSHQRLGFCREGGGLATASCESDTALAASEGRFYSAETPGVLRPVRRRHRINLVPER